MQGARSEAQMCPDAAAAEKASRVFRQQGRQKGGRSGAYRAHGRAVRPMNETGVRIEFARRSPLTKGSAVPSADEPQMSADMPPCAGYVLARLLARVVIESAHPLGLALLVYTYTHVR